MTEPSRQPETNTRYYWKCGDCSAYTSEIARTALVFGKPSCSNCRGKLYMKLVKPGEMVQPPLRDRQHPTDWETARAISICTDEFAGIAHILRALIAAGFQDTAKVFDQKFVIGKRHEKST